MSRRVTSLAFFRSLRWLDDSPLLDRIEEYRRAVFRKALDTCEGKQRRPRYNLVLCGRGKKNWKTADLVLAALYCLVIRRSPLGNDGLIVASDEGQAKDDLDLARKLVDCNPVLAAEIEPLAKELRLRDGSGSLRILPAKDVHGAHGKTYNFLGIDELHTSRSWDLLEALSPDPTRTDVLRWITSYDTIYNTPGVPLYDLKQVGKNGADPRMLFSWYSGGELNTDPEFAELEPELRANPSFGSWPEGRAYLDQQRRILPTHKYRRLHLNLPGAPEGAFFDQGKVLAAIVAGRTVLPYEEGRGYYAFVDMSGGGDDAVLAIAHEEDGKVVIDRIEQQAGDAKPFNPRMAVVKFCGILREYCLSRVMGDNYAGYTFRGDFESMGVSYTICPWSKSELYGALEPAINAGEVELLDVPKLQEQLLTLVVRGAKIDHEPNGHDDWANAAAGVVWRIRSFLQQERVPIVVPILAYGQPRAVPGGSVLSTAVAVAPSLAPPTPESASQRNPAEQAKFDYSERLKAIATQPRNELWRGFLGSSYGPPSFPRTRW
jgi:hypothetical protein